MFLQLSGYLTQFCFNTFISVKIQKTVLWLANFWSKGNHAISDGRWYPMILSDFSISFLLFQTKCWTTVSSIICYLIFSILALVSHQIMRQPSCAFQNRTPVESWKLYLATAAGFMQLTWSVCLQNMGKFIPRSVSKTPTKVYFWFLLSRNPHLLVLIHTSSSWA